MSSLPNTLQALRDGARVQNQGAPSSVTSALTPCSVGPGKESLFSYLMIQKSALNQSFSCHFSLKLVLNFRKKKMFTKDFYERIFIFFHHEHRVTLLDIIIIP